MAFMQPPRIYTCSNCGWMKIMPSHNDVLTSQDISPDTFANVSILLSINGTIVNVFFNNDERIVLGKSDEIHSAFSATELGTSDVLLKIAGASIGLCAKSDSLVSGENVNQHVCIIRMDETKLVPSLLVELINSEFGQNQIDSYQVEGIREGLNFSYARQHKFAIPEQVEDQTAIVTILSDMDEEIQELEQRLSKNRQNKQGMMQELLTGRIRLV